MTGSVSPARRSLRTIFLWPTIIAVVSTVGLIAALVGDGAWDVVSWIALVVPNLLFFFFVLRARGKAGG